MKNLWPALVLALLPAALLAAVTVVRSDQNGVSFRYVPGEVRLADGAGGREAVEFDDADHLAEPGELDLPGKVVRVGIPQTGGVRVSVRTGPEHKLEAVRLSTAPPWKWPCARTTPARAYHGE